MQAFDRELSEQTSQRNQQLVDELQKALEEKRSCEKARSFLEEKVVRKADEKAQSHGLHAFQSLVAPRGPQGDHDASKGTGGVKLGEARSVMTNAHGKEISKEA